MAEARTVDASARLDKMVDAEIDQARSDRRNAALFLLVFTVASIVFFALGNNVAGSVMLSIPVLGVIRTMWTSALSNLREPPKKHDDKRRQAE
ncbi:Uncharacterised protein [Mycobacteroides abscessus]|nr:Uncharacterised protein [Mycobacteroides abscessus]